MSRTFKLGIEKKPGAFVVAENFNDVVPAVVAFTAVHCPFSERTSEDRVDFAVRNVLLWPLHRVWLNLVRSGDLCPQEPDYPGTKQRRPGVLAYADRVRFKQI